MEEEEDEGGRFLRNDREPRDQKNGFGSAALQSFSFIVDMKVVCDMDTKDTYVFSRKAKYVSKKIKRYDHKEETRFLAPIRSACR